MAPCRWVSASRCGRATRRDTLGAFVTGTGGGSGVRQVGMQDETRAGAHPVDGDTEAARTPDEVRPPQEERPPQEAEPPRTVDDDVPDGTVSDAGEQDLHAEGDDTVDRGALILEGLRGVAAWSWRFLLVVAALAVILYVIAQVWVGVLPILLALIISSVLWPPVRWLRGHRVPAGLASVVVLLGALGVFAGIIAAISPSVAGQSREVAAQAGEGLDSIVAWLAGPPVNLQSDQLDGYVEQVTTWLQSQASALASGALSTLTTVGSAVTTFVLALVLTFFFLKDGPGFLPFVRRITGRTAGRHLTEALTRVWTTLGGFLRGQAIVAAIDAVFIGIGLVILGVPLAIPLAIITFFLSFIPIVGAVVAGALAVLVALVSQGFTTALWTLAVVLFVQQAESTFVSPTVQSRAVSIHPVLVLLGVAAGGTIWGILGAFLAVPIIACVLSVIRYGSEQLDLRTGEKHADEVRSLTPEGAQAAALAEQSAPVFQMRAKRAYLQAEGERGAARVAMFERTTDLATSLRDRLLSPILRRDGDRDTGPQPEEDEPRPSP